MHTSMWRDKCNSDMYLTLAHFWFPVLGYQLSWFVLQKNVVFNAVLDLFPLFQSTLPWTAFDCHQGAEPDQLSSKGKTAKEGERCPEPRDPMDSKFPDGILVVLLFSLFSDTRSRLQSTVLWLAKQGNTGYEPSNKNLGHKILDTVLGMCAYWRAESLEPNEHRRSPQRMNAVEVQASPASGI